MKSNDQRRQTYVRKMGLKFAFGELAISWIAIKQHWMILVFYFIGYGPNDTSSILDHIVVNGTAFRLNCSNENYKNVNWKFMNLSNEFTIYDNRTTKTDFKDTYSIDDSAKGRFDLSFIASGKTAGYYICATKDLPEPYVSLQITVFDATPTCSGEETNGVVRANCSFGFSGYLTPQLEWSNVNGKLEPNSSTGPTYLDSRISSVVIVPINETDSRAACFLKCTPKFTLENATAENIQHFPKSCRPEIKSPGNSPVEVGLSTLLNLAAVQGKPVQLSCSEPANDFGNWSYRNPLLSVSGEDIKIYDGHQIMNGLKNMFSTDTSARGRFQLAFTLSERTSGRYTCMSSASSQKTSGSYVPKCKPKVSENLPHHVSQVILLDEQPICSQEYTADFLKANCSIGFRGYWSPELEWYNANDMRGYTYTRTIDNSKVTSHIVVPFNQSEPPSSFIYTCTPKFTLRDRPAGTTAQNIPEFPHSCKTEPPETPQPQLPYSSDSINSHNYWKCSHVCLLCLVTALFIEMHQKPLQ